MNPALSIFLPDQQTLVSSRPESFVLAYCVAAAAGAVHPSRATQGWINAMTGSYDNTPSYWQPYAEVNGEFYMASWARGAYGYQTRAMGSSAVLPELLDPSVWHSRLRSQIEHIQMPDVVHGAFDLAIEQTSSIGPYADEVLDLWTRVRQAQQKGELLVDPRKIKARCAKAGVLP